VTASSLDAFLEEIREAIATGVDIVELRLDFLKDFDPTKDLDRIMAACSVPYIVTYRPAWEGCVTGMQPDQQQQQQQQRRQRQRQQQQQQQQQ
jgi:3-dehydroquinate dehydratase